MCFLLLQIGEKSTQETGAFNINSNVDLMKESTKELKRRILVYFNRCGVEESYRFEKQGFGIEKGTVRKCSKIKCLVGITILSRLTLVKINESPKLREELLIKAKTN